MANLVDIARDARDRAYAPYSGYKVGAALEDDLGRSHAGCNVENVSFGATICAERGALARLVEQGGVQIRRVVVVTEDGGAPCGICLQSMLEFAPEPQKVKVELFAGEIASGLYTLAQLMPRAFVSNTVRRTDA